MTKIFATACIALFLFVGTVSAQHDEERINMRITMPEVALVDIEHIGNGTLEFELLPSSETGGAPVIKQKRNEEMWLNYSSARSKYSQNRSIVAQISTGNLPEGLSLFVHASNYRGTGKGEMGISAGKVLIDSNPRSIITNIGSGYTGNGIGNGHMLSFEVDINLMEKIIAIESTDITILYTLTDN